MCGRQVGRWQLDSKTKFERALWLSPCQDNYLFSLYVNDLSLHTNFQVNMFADDAVLILKNKNKAHLQQQVNQELTFIDEWMKYNRLSLNYTKTTYFCLCSKMSLKFLE